MPKKSDAVDPVLVLYYRSASKRMFGDFQSDRLAVSVGESIGRQLSSKSSTSKVTKDIVALINQVGLGSAKEGKPQQKAKGFEPLGEIIVSDSLESQAFKKAGKPVCQLIRGLIRGAYIGVYNQQNIAVKETKCASKGDKECVFEAYWIPM